MDKFVIWNDFVNLQAQIEGEGGFVKLKSFFVCPRERDNGALEMLLCWNLAHVNFLQFGQLSSELNNSFLKSLLTLLKGNTHLFSEF